MLKKGTKVIANANTLVQVRPGLGPPDGEEVRSHFDFDF